MSFQDQLEQFKQTDFYKKTDFIKDFDSKAENLDDWLSLAQRWANYQSEKSELSTHIPKTIHQVWVGSPLPDKYKNWTESWKRNGWEYNLWTEEKLLPIFTEEEKEWYFSTPNPGPRSDLARYKLLALYGGIYCDTDFECLKDFSPVTDTTTLFAGVIFDTKPEIAGGIVGAVPSHPLILETLKKLLECKKLNLEYNNILDKTGPAFFTRIIQENKELLKPTDVFFPTHYLYPLPNYEAVNSISPKKLKHKFIKPESIAIHYWEVSWTPDSNWLIRCIKTIIKKVIFYEYWKK